MNMDKLGHLLESIREAGGVAFQDIAGEEDVIIEIINFLPIIHATWDSPAEGGDVEIKIYNSACEDITSEIQSNFKDDYLRVKDTAYNVAAAFMGEDK